MHDRLCEFEGRQRPFPRQCQQAEEEVEDLEDWNRSDDGVEVGSEEIPKDFWPEEAFEGSGDLVDGGGEDDEAGPVVLDEFAHED